MKTEEVLSYSPKILTQEQREFYFDQGYLLLEKFISDEWLDTLWATTNEFIGQSRVETPSKKLFDVEPSHTPNTPRLRRLISPVDVHPVYREFTFEGPLADLAQDLLGPNVKYHHSKLNFKWSDGGEEVKWHQDIQYWPHTNYSPLTIGVYLSDVNEEMGPMGVIPESHKGPLFDLYNENNEWTGALSDQDVARVGTHNAVWLKGPRGSVTVHNCRMIHGSMPNHSSRMRPLLLQTYAAADAITLTNLTDRSPLSNRIVRGKAAKWIDFDPRPCLMPPDWSAGYRSIFAVQQMEEDAGSRTVAGNASRM